MGVEPTSQPWEGRILPMKYTRKTHILYQTQYQKSIVFTKKYESARARSFSRSHISKLPQNNRAEIKQRRYDRFTSGFSFTKQRLRKSNGITENASDIIAQN